MQTLLNFKSLILKLKGHSCTIYRTNAKDPVKSGSHLQLLFTSGSKSGI